MKNVHCLYYSIIGCLTFLYPACRPGRDSAGRELEEARKAIAASNSIYFEAFAKNDSSVFIDRYAADACIMAPGAPVACGRAAILLFFQTAYRQIGLRNGRFITTNVYGNGNGFVTEEGRWESYNAANQLFDNGKFLVRWKKTDQGWKMYRDAFSSDRSQ
ncbi:DUF4440 domain-containing protein [Chitinophaga pendula]|uniref:YybH family protein n=1 Tax=Chitinophaga TaxID=79328 RepID=UPI000BAF6F7B|nr:MULTISPECIES: DUF4440 domain-containing protein [Chitinophaga]ASZ14993.1 DUF4440 domain-containing protein [Chitinophaga sp. MD30]UCJ09732.1 DUF4440 domain-containing protein [Chitinophaga pendula]